MAKGKIVVLISDGECQEGTTCESLLIASKHELDNLIVIIDYNKIQMSIGEASRQTYWGGSEEKSQRPSKGG